MDAQTRLDALDFFRSLADESRLRMIGILAGRECSVKGLAAMLDATAPTVSQHLDRLRRKGLVSVRAEGSTHLYRLDMATLRRYCREALPTEKSVAFGDDVEAEPWEQQVLDNFFRGERLTEIPVARKKRLVVLKWLAGLFEPGVAYPEAHVNEVISRHHPDFAALRRYLVDEGFLRRHAGVYQRPTAGDWGAADPAAELTP